MIISKEKSDREFLVLYNDHTLIFFKRVRIIIETKIFAIVLNKQIIYSTLKKVVK